MEYYVVLGNRVFGRFTDLTQAYHYRDKIMQLYECDEESPMVLMKLR